MYDIRKISEYGQPAKWGREYYAKDSIGFFQPVLFIPYFETDKIGLSVINWRFENGTRVRDGYRTISRRKIYWDGIKKVFKDLPRIITRRFYADLPH